MSIIWVVRFIMADEPGNDTHTDNVSKTTRITGSVFFSFFPQDLTWRKEKVTLHFLAAGQNVSWPLGEWYEDRGCEWCVKWTIDKRETIFMHHRRCTYSWELDAWHVKKTQGNQQFDNTYATTEKNNTTKSRRVNTGVVVCQALRATVELAPEWPKLSTITLKLLGNSFCLQVAFDSV